MRQKVLRVGLRLIGPVLLVVVLLRMKDMGAILRTFREADLAPFLAAVLHAGHQLGGAGRLDVDEEVALVS